MFQLTLPEWSRLKSQFVTSNRGGRRYMPNAFTEHGVAMLASVLNSEKAIKMNIASLMRQPLPYITIYPGSGNSAYKRNCDNSGARSHLGKQGSRAGAGYCPTQSENEPTKYQPFVEFLIFQVNGLALY